MSTRVYALSEGEECSVVAKLTDELKLDEVDVYYAPIDEQFVTLD